MRHLTAKPMIKDEEEIREQNASHVWLILTAWLGTLLLSRLPRLV